MVEDTKPFLILELVGRAQSLQEEVAWLTVFAPESSFTIAPGHQPLFAILPKQTNLAYLRRDGHLERTQSVEGFIRLWGNKITAVID